MLKNASKIKSHVSSVSSPRQLQFYYSDYSNNHKSSLCTSGVFVVQLTFPLCPKWSLWRREAQITCMELLPPNKVNSSPFKIPVQNTTYVLQISNFAAFSCSDSLSAPHFSFTMTHACNQSCVKGGRDHTCNIRIESVGGLVTIAACLSSLFNLLISFCSLNPGQSDDSLLSPHNNINSGSSAKLPSQAW